MYTELYSLKAELNDNLLYNLNVDVKENMLVCKALKEEALIINCTLFDAECIAKLIVEYITNVLYYYPYTNHQC